VIVRAHVEKSFEQQGKRVGGRFLQRENLDEVIVDAQVTAMAFEVRLTKVVVKKGVVLQPGGVEF